METDCQMHKPNQQALSHIFEAGYKKTRHRNIYIGSQNRLQSFILTIILSSSSNSLISLFISSNHVCFSVSPTFYPMQIDLLHPSNASLNLHLMTKLS